MDLDLPFREGIIAIERIREVDPTTHILGLVTSEWDDVGREAVRAGARCCLSKDRLNEELVLLIREPKGDLNPASPEKSVG